MPVPLYLVLGALLGGASAFGIQYAILQAAGALPHGLPLARLAFDVMDVPRYAVYGALLVVFVSTMSRHWHGLPLRCAGWLASVTLAGIATGLLPLWLALGRWPTLVEALPALTPANRYLLVGLVTAGVFIVVETALQPRRPRRRRLADDDEVPVDFDRVANAGMSARADAWLAARRAGNGSTGASSDRGQPPGG